MPPRWAPESNLHTARLLRANFLKGNEQLGKTSRDYLIEIQIAMKNF